MKKINVGIIGFGLSGRVFHSTLLKVLPEYEIKKVFSSQVEVVKEHIPNTEVVESVENIMSDKEIELVILCGPNTTHYPQAKLALKSGKHVVVEKPFVIKSKEGEELIALAQEHNRILTVFQNRRWDGDFLTVKKLIADRELGDVYQFDSHFDRWRPTIRDFRWRERPGPGSGILYDLGAHLIDQCLDLFGMPDEIMADLDDQKENHGVVDYFHIILKYKKMRAILHSSSFKFKNPRFSILGDKGNYIKYGLDPQEAKMAGGLSPLSEGFGNEEVENYGILSQERDSKRVETLKGNYLEFYKKLADAIVNNDSTEVPVSAESSLKVIKLIEFAQESSSKKTWVNCV